MLCNILKNFRLLKEHNSFLWLISKIPFGVKFFFSIELVLRAAKVKLPTPAFIG